MSLLLEPATTGASHYWSQPLLEPATTGASHYWSGATTGATNWLLEEPPLEPLEPLRSPLEPLGPLEPLEPPQPPLAAARVWYRNDNHWQIFLWNCLRNRSHWSHWSHWSHRLASTTTAGRSILVPHATTIHWYLVNITNTKM